MTTTFGVSQDDYLRRMVSSTAVLMIAMQEVLEEANRHEDLSLRRVHLIAQSALERVAKL